MDLFDLFPFSGPEDLGRRKLTRGESIASAVAVIVLPLADLALAMLLAPDGHANLLLLWLPLLFTALAAVTCRVLRVGVWRSIALLLGCAFWCFFASATVFLMNVMFLPW